jgi:hypothetical protein
MAKKKAEKWPPNHPAGSGPEPESGTIMNHFPGSSLVDVLSAMPGMNRGLAERVVNDGNWPAEGSELARRYGLMQLDADEIQKVLNRNRGEK